LGACKERAAASGTSPSAGDAKAGQAIFVARCALCHATTDEGKEGPGLGGILGRKAATTRFAYSQALRSSGLVWDTATLDRFLQSPPTVVPGTTMPLAVPDDTERRDLVAYLATLPAATAPAPAPTPAAKAGTGDFRGDAPGHRHKIAVSDLPAPFATPSARNSPRVVDRPASAQPSVPAGFVVDLYAKDLQNPRLLRVAPNGDLFVAESAPGRIRVLRGRDGAKAPDKVGVFASGLSRPFGIAFYPPGTDPKWIYVANTNSVVRFPYKNGDLQATAAPETVVPRLTARSGGHWTRDVAFSRDGKRMFLSVGSASNVAEGMGTPSARERAAADARGLGAAWDEEENRADVLVFDPDGRGQRVYAAGLRNCVGLAVSPATGDVWCSTNERDGLGDDLVPDYITRLREGAFYGWPWYYLGDHEDPRLKGARPDLVGHVTVPDVLLQAHSASLQLTFYDGQMFPEPFRGSVFASFHGSWNRATRTGPKVVRVIIENGVPTGEYEDFVTGFVIDNADVWGRPVGVAVAHDGALFVSEDGNGTIWRVATTIPRAP
jgi:glucose/arabinose dehydrogenase